MELFELILILLACVMASAVADQFIPHLSLPLLQIAVGLVIALIVPILTRVHIEAELFLMLFIAPLLYRDFRYAAIQYLQGIRESSDSQRAQIAEVLLEEHEASLQSLWGIIGLLVSGNKKETRMGLFINFLSPHFLSQQLFFTTILHSFIPLSYPNPALCRLLKS